MKTVDCHPQDTGLGDQPDFSFFLAARGETRGLIERGIDRVAGWMMAKRRLTEAGFPTLYSNRSFRPAGITNFLKNGGNFEVAQRIAGRADSRTTKALCPPRPEGPFGEYGEDSELNCFDRYFRNQSTSRSALCKLKIRST